MVTQLVCVLGEHVAMTNKDYQSHRIELGTRIRMLRTEQGLSTRKFAAMVGISKSHLRKIEIAEASPTFDMLERVSAGLDITVSDLVDFER